MWAELRAAINRLNFLMHTLEELKARIEGLEQQLRDVQGR
jgi:hypothetical protein